MSKNTIDRGEQILAFDYMQEARAAGFNRIFCDLLPYGVYTGGKLTRASDTSVTVSPVVCFIRSNEADNVATRIQTQKECTLSLCAHPGEPIDASKQYIVLRFGWHNQDKNFMDVLAVGWTDDTLNADPDYLMPFDIILGRVQFKDISGKRIIDEDNPFDLTRRQEVFLKGEESLYSALLVRPTEPPSDKV